MEAIIKLRKAQLKIAKEIKRICEKYDINYFLDAGSMLGAVRHGGYIPWDDDMDIGMLDSDYERFLSIASGELNNEFFIDNYKTNKDCALVFTKVRLKGTIYIENKGNPNLKHNEIFVDVFPYYFISDDDMERKIEAFLMAFLSQAILAKSGYKVWKGEKWTKRLKFLPSDIIGCLLTKEKMHEIINRLYHKHIDTKYLCVHAGSAYNYWYFPREVFDDYIEIEFEGELFKIPEKYDVFLTQAYGDYMTLPPKKDRITHQVQKLDIGNVIL